MTSPIDSTLGSFLVTVFMAAILYGITTTQSYIYWLNYPQDTRVMRFAVLAVWLLETCHTGFCIHAVYNYAVINFGYFPGVLHIIWSVPITVLLGVLLPGLVQTFFIHRIWILSDRKLAVTLVPSFLLFLRVGLGVATSALAWLYGNFLKFRAETPAVVTLSCGLGLAVVVDLMIAFTLVYYLHKSRSGFKTTDNLVRTLQTYVINSGGLTMVCSIAVLATFAALADNYVFLGLVEIQSKLYANSFLATLNARQYLVANNSRGTREYVSNASTNIRLRAMDGPLPSPRHIEIFQQVTKATDHDMGETPLRDSMVLSSPMDMPEDDTLSSKDSQKFV